MVFGRKKKSNKIFFFLIIPNTNFGFRYNSIDQNYFKKSINPKIIFKIDLRLKKK